MCVFTGCVCMCACICRCTIFTCVQVCYSVGVSSWPALSPWRRRRRGRGVRGVAGGPPSLCWREPIPQARRCTLTLRGDWCGQCCSCILSTARLTSSQPSWRSRGGHYMECAAWCCDLCCRFSDHFEVMFGDRDHPSWDRDHSYRPDTLQVCACVLHGRCIITGGVHQ